MFDLSEIIQNELKEQIGGKATGLSVNATSIENHSENFGYYEIKFWRKTYRFIITRNGYYIEVALTDDCEVFIFRETLAQIALALVQEVEKINGDY